MRTKKDDRTNINVHPNPNLDDDRRDSLRLLGGHPWHLQRPRLSSPTNTQTPIIELETSLVNGSHKPASIN